MGEDAENKCILKTIVSRNDVKAAAGGDLSPDSCITMMLNPRFPPVGLILHVSAQMNHPSTAPCGHVCVCVCAK